MSTVNVRTLYDTATTGINVNAAAVLADDNIQVEFLQGTIASSSDLIFKNTSGFFGPNNWWENDSATESANGFVGNQSLSGFNFPCIGSIMANTASGFFQGHININSNWLMFCPGRESDISNPATKLLIKAVPKAQKKITGYTIYFYDDAEGGGDTGGIGITSGDVNTTTTPNTTTTHNSRHKLTMSESAPNWNITDEDGYANVRSCPNTGLNITDSGYIYINIDDNGAVAGDPALIKLEFTVENDVLAAPTVTFPSGTVDLGVASTINKTPDSINWEYSINSGASWISGTGDSYQLPVGTYNAETVYVRNNDGSRESTEVKNQNQIIVRPPPPTVDFPAPNPFIQDATVTITSFGTGASEWQYSINAGGDWSNGSGTTFSLLAGTYTINQIQVRNGDGTGNNWSTTTKNDSNQIVVSFSPPVVVFPASGDNGIVNITLGNSATAWQYSINAGVDWSNGSGTKFTLQAHTYAAGVIQVRNGDGTNWSTTINNDSEIEISAPPTPPPEPVSTTEPVDIRKSYYPESKVNSTSNSLFNKVYSQKLLTSVDKIERTPLALKKDKSVEQYHNGTQDRLLRIKSKAMNNK